MSKFCHNCGNQLDDNASFCGNCGAKQEAQAQGGAEYNYQQSAPTQNPGIITYRGVAVAIILSIITCGIYGIFWMACVNDDSYRVLGEPIETSGGMVILFTIITCGIYGLYWNYKMGERVDRIKGVNGSSGILFLILSLFGLGIISMALIQDALNKSGQAC